MFNVPTLAELRERVAGHFEATIKDQNGQSVDAHTPGTGYTEEAIVVAGVAYGLYGYQSWIAKQIHNAQADDLTIIQRAAEKGIPQIPPSFSAGTATATGTDGATINNGTVYQSSSGEQFRVSANETIVGGNAPLSIIAVNAGAEQNFPAGDTLTLITPVENVDSDITIDAPGLTGGAAVESVDRVRARVVAHDQFPPLGGKKYDYETWAVEAHVDVTRAWAFFHETGVGSVVVRIVTEDLASPIPTAAIVSTVNDYIEERRPAGARSFTTESFSEVPLNLNFTLLNPNTLETQAAIEAELADFVRRFGAPDSVLERSRIRGAIANTPGIIDFEIDMSGNLTLNATEFPTLGTTTWPAV
jgi:uncharacterized phage protein gp47/JayE